MPEIFIDSNGVKLRTITQGQGHPVMLCNGGPGCCDYLGPVAAMIDDVAQVIRFEQRGCGRSEPAPPYDVDTCVTDLENIRRHYGIDRWIIGGHSWGADLALAYALRYPTHVSGLMGVAGGRIVNDREWHAEYSRCKPEEEPELPDYDYPFNSVVNEQVSRSWKQYIQRPTLLKEIAQLAVPALFVYGDQDIRPRWPTEQLANLMPNACFELIEGATHYIWYTHSDVLRSLLRDFIRGLK
jgi:proline iminopeptidase